MGGVIPPPLAGARGGEPRHGGGMPVDLVGMGGMPVENPVNFLGQKFFMQFFDLKRQKLIKYSIHMPRAGEKRAFLRLFCEK